MMYLSLFKSGSKGLWTVLGCFGCLLLGKFQYFHRTNDCILLIFLFLSLTVGLSVKYWPSNHDDSPYQSKSKTDEQMRNNYLNTLKEISMLKSKLADLEVESKRSGLVELKSFPQVKFLNYKDKKRILVGKLTHLSTLIKLILQFVLYRLLVELVLLDLIWWTT